jgi:aldehyde:ferredoxin oxidoreductase
MKGGYAGHLLFIDLSTGLIQEELLSDEIATKFIGGYGIGARILYDRMKPGVDPLGPENILGFVTGPCTATGADFSGRYTVVCKSPVSGTWNDANSGGFFGPELKRAGYDGVFVSGAASKPVCIWINNGQVEVRDASHLWGLDVYNAEEMLRKEIRDKKMVAALIGPAGEKKSLLACVMNDRHRAAGRGGLGAVMGSKNLKAIAVRGTREVPIADPSGLKAVNKKIVAGMKTAQLASLFKEGGTGIGSAASALSGDSPVKNWGGVGIDDIGEQDAEIYNTLSMNRYRTKAYACANCPLGCGAHYTVPDGPWPLSETDRPEYETIASFGSMMLNTDQASIIKCNDICNRAGLDTISTGTTIAWAVECYENGILTAKDTGGIELRWGNGPAIVQMTQAIADHQGFGATLAFGSAGAARILGKGSEYLQTVRGVELPMHDPRLGPGLARTYQFDPTPARHVKGGTGLEQLGKGPEKYNPEGSGPNDVKATIFTELLNSAGLCLFFMFGSDVSYIVPLIEAACGLDNQSQMAAGMRILTMRHVFNLREGLTPADFVLPPRSIGKPPLEAGPLANITVPAEALADNYFATLDWDRRTGKPSRQSLEQMGGMEDVIKDLYG